MTVTNINNPKFILFYEDKNFEKRVKSIKKNSDLKYETTIDSGFIDKVMHKLN